MQPNQPNPPQEQPQSWPQPPLVQQSALAQQPVAQQPVAQQPVAQQPVGQASMGQATMGGWGMPQGAPRTSAPVAVAAGLLALVAAGLLVWYAIVSTPHSPGDIPWSGVERMNVIGGFGSAAALVVLAVFVFTRVVAAAWFLVVVCAVFVVLTVVLQPLSGGSFSAQFDFVFGFHKTTGVAIGLATIVNLLTAIVAAVAGATSRPR